MALRFVVPDRWCTAHEGVTRLCASFAIGSFLSFWADADPPPPPIRKTAKPNITIRCFVVLSWSHKSGFYRLGMPGEGPSVGLLAELQLLPWRSLGSAILPSTGWPESATDRRPPLPNATACCIPRASKSDLRTFASRGGHRVDDHTITDKLDQWTAGFEDAALTGSNIARIFVVERD